MKDQSGGVAIIFALMISMLVLAVALPMDLGRGFMATSAISGASDAAALASAVSEGDDDKAEAYFKANLPNGTLGIEYDYNQNVEHTVDTATGDISVKTSGFTVPALFSEGTNSSGAVALAGNTVVGLPNSATVPADIIIVMDASGSMGYLPKINGSKVTSYNPVTIIGGQQVFKWEALEAAVLSFFDIIFANQGNGPGGLPFFRVSLKSYDSNLRGNEPFVGDQAQLVGYFPNIISPGSSTNPGIALEKARLELPNSASGRRKIIVFLTDGQFNTPSSGPWSWPPDYTGAQGNSVAHKYAASECHEINQNPDVDFWSIRFGAAANSGLNFDVMEYCASDPSQNVFAADGTVLHNIFVDIATQVSRVRIKQ